MKYLRARGVARTMQLLLSDWRDRMFDRAGGFDTGTLEDLNVLHNSELPTLKHATIYGPTRARPFMSLLQALQISKDAGFVDLGCGKGRALIVAAQYGVKKLKGLELVPEFIHGCEMNLRKLRTAGGPIEWRILQRDLKSYEVSPEDDVIYLYDPCAWSDVRMCLNNILASCGGRPRHLQVIYHNNLIARAQLEAELTGFDSFEEYWFDGNRFFVFGRAPNALRSSSSGAV